MLLAPFLFTKYYLKSQNFAAKIAKYLPYFHSLIDSYWLAMPSKVGRCCICGIQKSTRWYSRESYQESFHGCFGAEPSHNSAFDSLCSSCQSDVNKYKRTGKTLLNKLDSKKGKKGRPGHRLIGGVRTKSSPDDYVNINTPRGHASHVVE